ncbi:MAG: choice-of-anchor L domain-containing protein [Chloroflexota bacterium]
MGYLLRRCLLGLAMLVRLQLVGASAIAAQEVTAPRQGNTPPGAHNLHPSSSHVTNSAIIAALGLNSSIVQSLSFGTSDHNGFNVFTTAAPSFPTQGDSYLVMSSGCTSVALGANTSGSTRCTLSGLNNQQGTDLVQMALVLTVPAGALSWSVDWKFFSEEFPEFVGSSFNDAFLIERGSSNFTIFGNQITAPNNVAFDSSGQLITINTTGAFGMTSANAAGTTYDGATQKLTTTAPIPAGATFLTLIFSVMDLGDSVYDTTVFIDNFRFVTSQTGNPETGVGTISCTVYADNALPIHVVNRARVGACRVGGICNHTETNSSGQYTFSGLAAGQYALRAFPPSGSSLLPGLLGPLTLAAGGSLTGQDIILNTPFPAPTATTITPSVKAPGDVPKVFAGQPFGLLTFANCFGAAPTSNYKIFRGTSLIASGPMTPQLAAGSYGAVVPALSASPIPARVEITIDCPPASGGPLFHVFNIYTDPSGVVKTVEGVPIPGATVTLFRTDSLGAPFEIVSDGSSLMSPSNRKNPDTTNADGLFGWDVIAGFYKVRAEKAGCVSPANPAQSFVESAVLTIPPPVTDLELVLSCPTLDAAPPTTAVTLTATLGSNGWYRSPVDVTLTATDNAGGSGVAATYYAVDNASCTPAALTSCSIYGGAFTIGVEGTHAVSLL